MQREDKMKGGFLFQREQFSSNNQTFNLKRERENLLNPERKERGSRSCVKLGSNMPLGCM